MTMNSLKLLPGTQFPSILIKTVDDKQVNLHATGNYKLVIIYRGAFCPFCIDTLKEINSRVNDIKAAGIEEVIAVSADKEEVVKQFAHELGLTFPIAYDLSIAQIREMGLYLSSPTHYIAQTHQFSEPAYFLLNPDNSIRYIDIASTPFGGRVNVDNLLSGFGWVIEQERNQPEFKTVIWGSQ